MRNLILNNITRKLYVVAAMAAMLIAPVSCIEEWESEIEGKGTNNLRVDAGPDALAVSPTVTSTVKIANIWRDANSPAGLKSGTTVTFSTDPALVADYNEENGTNYEPLPTQYFSFEPATLTFAEGDFVKELNIKMNAAGLDLSKDYAIGLVSTADGWRAVGNKFIAVALPSAYEGDYVSTGVRYNYNATSDAKVDTWPPTGFASSSAWNFDPTTASTLSSKTVAVHAANDNGGFGRINLTVTDEVINVDGQDVNVVNITPNSDIGLNALVKSTHRESTYNPATKTFELYYEYTNTNGTFRNLYHKLVKK